MPALSSPKLRTLIVALALATGLANAVDAQSSRPSVLYKGCLPGDPEACAFLTFYDADFLGYWQFDPPGLIAVPGFNYFIRDDMWYFRSPDGTCQGAAISWYVTADSCAITQRYTIQWFAPADIHSVNQTGAIGQVLLTFSTVAPEPSAVLLLGSGLVGVFGFAGARVRARTGRGRSDVGGTETSQGAA